VVAKSTKSRSPLKKAKFKSITVICMENGKMAHEGCAHQLSLTKYVCLPCLLKYYLLTALEGRVRWSWLSSSRVSCCWTR
jgi:hypothetical protein